MAAMHNVEAEAAKFLQRLIQESKDEPEKLATKLYVILQHMKASGKENSMPYQVISRAMETVINEHGLDIEALKSSRLPISGGSQIGDSGQAQSAGCSQIAVAAKESKSGFIESDLNRTDVLSSSHPPVGPSSAVHDPYQMSVSHRSGKSFDHESPSSLDTRSANSHSHERRDRGSWEQQANKKESKKPTTKRKRSDSTLGMEPHMDNCQQLEAHDIGADVRQGNLINKVELPGSFPGAAGKFHVGSHGASSPYLVVGGLSGTRSSEPGDKVESEYWKQGPKGAKVNFPERPLHGHTFPTQLGEEAISNLNPASRTMTEDVAGISNISVTADRVVQGASANTLTEMNMLRGAAPRDVGKSTMLPVPSLSSMPFKEHHLKQLRAQCLVFLAFRNGIMPKRMHLEIALGSNLPTEGNSYDAMHRESIDNKEKEQGLSGPNNSLQGYLVHPSKIDRVPPSSSISGSDRDCLRFSKENENARLADEKSSPGPTRSVIDERQPHLPPARRFMDDEFQSQEASGPSAFMAGSSRPDNSILTISGHNNHEDIADNVHLHTGGRQLRHETVVGGHNEAARESLSSSIGLVPRKDGSPNQFRLIGDPGFRGHLHVESHLSTLSKPIQGIDTEQQIMKSANDANTLLVHGSHGHPVRSSNPFIPLDKRSSELVEEVLPMADALLPSPEYTTSEYWIVVQQKRRLLSRQNWVKKQENGNQNIAARFNELKETVSSSEDISAKTRSVIELKKLQLLELQRRLRSDIMNDFFKVIKPEMDYLKGVKKHRIGRRLKQVEKYEQRMKEERQKRIRERQKEFFSEIEVHKERLEDVFKLKRERWRGFNKYIKEFHKKKERMYREKNDRIQREKINLLKINDVEGYLRMIQDAKSDRVKQLLKETEKYLQKLGSKLQEAKPMARCFEVEMDEARISSIVECSDIVAETEDENDQAKHYKESNEKYYMIAHSVKENITEQPAGLRGGKLREYQMNGLRWLVSLYNNHLNGILADEMGLGKTVQVIALICYLMEAKNDRGPFLVVVPSSVLPGWVSEINFWAPGISKIIYSGPPEERRRLFKECIVQKKFNVLLTTYEYLMNKHDRPKLSKLHWHYIIIDEGHRIKNASCKLNADLKHYQSSHRLLLTGTPLQNNLEELWALLNFLLPNIFNSSEDFSQWFNKPFESNGDNSADEALLSEEENLLIINRLHQVLRPFVLRRLKQKVENELPEKIERLVRCEASAYQKLLMKRVEDNLGSLGGSKVRSVHNSVIELRNICNHPYISQLHTDEVDALIPKHFLPPIVRLCGKLEMLDRLLPKLKATNHRVLFFSTMTRLLDVMEEYLVWKRYRYLRLDGQTSGNDRGALIDNFNHPDSPFFIFLLSIRAGGVGVNLQAADTVIIFDTDWNPQVDLQAQARAHRIGQKKEVLVLRLETVNTVEEQVRAAAEHKLGVANQSITAGFFDNNTSAEDRREYLESLLRECKKEAAAPVLNDDGLNDLLARSESEIDIFESIDRKRQEEEMEAWRTMLVEQGIYGSDDIPALPPRLVTDEDLKPFYEAMKVYEVTSGAVSTAGIKRKSAYLGSFDTQQYGRGKRAREVRSYEEQWTEEEFEKLCQADSLDILKPKQELKDALVSVTCASAVKIEPSAVKIEPPFPPQVPLSSELSPLKQEVTPPVKRGRGRPRRVPLVASPSPLGHPLSIGVNLQALSASSDGVSCTPDPCPHPSVTENVSASSQQVGVKMVSDLQTAPPSSSLTADPSTYTSPSVAAQAAEQSSKGRGTDAGRRRGRKPYKNSPSAPAGPVGKSQKSSVETLNSASSTATSDLAVQNRQSSEPLAKDASPSAPPSAVQSLLSGQKPIKEALLSAPADLAIGNPESIERVIKKSLPSVPAGVDSQAPSAPGNVVFGNPDPCLRSVIESFSGATQQVSAEIVFDFQTTTPLKVDPSIPTCASKTAHPAGESPNGKGTAETGRRRGKKSNKNSPSLPAGPVVEVLKSGDRSIDHASSTFPVGVAVEKPQDSKQPGKDASPSVSAGLVVQSLPSGEHPDKETIPLVPVDLAVASPKSSEQAVPSAFAGLVAQGSESAFQPIEQASPTAHSGLAIHDAETSKQLSKHEIPSVLASLGLREPTSKKRKIKLPSSDITAVPVVPSSLVATTLSLLSHGPVASVSQSSSDPVAAVVNGGTPHFGLSSYPSTAASDSHSTRARMQSPKSQSGAEPTRRRGRKPALPGHVASSVSTVQDPRSLEPLKYAVSNAVPSAVVPTPHDAGNLGMGSQTVVVPMIPLDPVSGLVPGAISVKDATGSVHHLSVGFETPCLPPTQQLMPVLPATANSQTDPAMKTQGPKDEFSSGEATPRRRGRKTAPITAADPMSLTGHSSSLRQMKCISGDFVEGKGAKQRLEDDSLVLTKMQELQRVHDPVSSPTKEPKSNEEDKLSSQIQQPKVVNLARSSPVNEGVTKKVNEGDKAPDSRNGGSATDPPLTSSIINVETSRILDHRTTIVLALKSVSPTVYPISTKCVNRFGSEECLDFQEDTEPKRVSPLETRLFVPVGTLTSEVSVISQFDEEMSAPPGFDTPRSHVNTLVGTSLGSEDAKFHGKAFLLPEEICLPGRELVVGSSENLIDPTNFIDEDSVPPGFGTDPMSSSVTKISKSLPSQHKDTCDDAFMDPVANKADTVLTGGPSDGGDSSDLVDEDSVPPGFERQACKEKEKNEAADLSISSNKVLREGQADKNLMEGSHEVCHAVQTSLAQEQTKDKCVAQEAGIPVQAEVLGSGTKGDVCKAEAGISSASSDENPISCSEESMCALVAEKKDDCSSKIPPYSPFHISDASMVLEQENSQNRNSMDSFVEDRKPIMITSSSVANSNAMIDVTVEASHENISNSDIVSCSFVVEAPLDIVSASRHEENSHDLDSGEGKSENTDASSPIVGECAGTIELNQKNDVGQNMCATTSIHNVAEPVEPVCENQITEVNVEAALNLKACKEGGRIAESRPENVPESHVHPINKHQLIKQPDKCVDVPVLPDENAGTDVNISLPDSCSKGSMPEVSSGKDTVMQQVSCMVSGHDQKEASQCSMQHVHSTKITPNVIKVCGAEREENADAAPILGPEVCDKENMLTGSCSGIVEFPLCPIVEASMDPADMVASDAVSGNDHAVEAGYSVETSSPTNVEPSHAFSGDGSEVEAVCSMQTILETVTDPANVEPSNDVFSDNVLVEAECAAQPRSESSTGLVNIAVSCAVSNDYEMMEVEYSMMEEPPRGIEASTVKENENACANAGSVPVAEACEEENLLSESSPEDTVLPIADRKEETQFQPLHDVDSNYDHPKDTAQLEADTAAAGGCSGSVADYPDDDAQPEAACATSATSSDGANCTAECFGSVTDCSMDKALPEAGSATFSVSPDGVCDKALLDGAADCSGSVIDHCEDEVQPKGDRTILAISTKAAKDTSLLIEDHSVDEAPVKADGATPAISSEVANGNADNLLVLDAAADCSNLEAGCPTDESQPVDDNVTHSSSTEP